MLSAHRSLAILTILSAAACSRAETPKFASLAGDGTATQAGPTAAPAPSNSPTPPTPPTPSTPIGNPGTAPAAALPAKISCQGTSGIPQGDDHLTLVADLAAQTGTLDFQGWPGMPNNQDLTLSCGPATGSTTGRV